MWTAGPCCRIMLAPGLPREQVGACSSSPVVLHGSHPAQKGVWGGNPQETACENDPCRIAGGCT